MPVPKRGANEEIPPEEWDFRPICEEELETVIIYEYARERDWLKRAVAEESWMVPHWFAAIATLFPEFPRPWLTIEEKSRVERARLVSQTNPNGRLPAFAETPMSDVKKLNLMETQADRLRYGYGYHLLFVNWNCSFTELRKEAVAWLKKSRPSKITPKSRTGKAGAAPFEKLKWLSAFRFNDRGITRSDAMDRIAKRQKTVLLNSEFDILPNYHGDSEWSRAIQKARIYLWQNFQNPMALEPAPFPVKRRTRKN